MTRLEWSPLYPHPSSPSIFPGRGADLLGLPSHPSEPAALAALTPETTPAPGAPKCFQVALTLPTGEEPPHPGSIDVVNYPSNSLKSIAHKMMFGQTRIFTAFCFNGNLKAQSLFFGCGEYTHKLSFNYQHSVCFSAGNNSESDVYKLNLLALVILVRY